VRPEVARELVGQGADLLVSLGGDDPAVPSMHGDTTARDLTLAVFRAVETRRYLVRAAGAGPSGFVDPTGELYAMIDAGRSGATVGRVSPRSDLTPYVRFGDVWLLVVGLAVGATLLAEPPRSVA
jgi:apolipoprotein N-acyltransferase